MIFWLENCIAWLHAKLQKRTSAQMRHMSYEEAYNLLLMGWPIHARHLADLAYKAGVFAAGKPEETQRVRRRLEALGADQAAISRFDRSSNVVMHVRITESGIEELAPTAVIGDSIAKPGDNVVLRHPKMVAEEIRLNGKRLATIRV